MPTEMIKKFASDACTLISGCQEFIGELMAELKEKDAKISEMSDKLNKQASEAPAPAPAAEAAPQFDETALNKAASAVHAVYGSPANVSVEDISNAWKNKPEFMVSAITTLASELINRTSASAEGLGKPIAKKASAAAPVSADEAFMNKYI